MIDTRLLNAYVSELEALRNHGRDLATIYPDIAGRLDIGAHRSRDPHVERVVESAAFLAARLRLMINSTATEIPLATLSALAPALSEPVPSMALLKFQSGSEHQEVPRGSRFDYQVGGQVLACFSTTTNATISPLSLRIRRLQPSRAHSDGLAVRLLGLPPPKTLTLCLGNDELSAATLMDGFDEALSAIEVIPPGGGAPINIPKSYVRIHGFERNEAALPVRPAAHRAHRIVTEFMVFPEKFRFISLTGLPLRPKSEIRFRFSRPLQLPPMLPPDVITVNRIPSVNLWQAVATPIDVNGHKIEYPVRVDSLRYRTTECHIVEKCDMYSAGNKPIRLDPVVAMGEVQETDIRWGIRRNVSRGSSEVLMYFQGLDYSVLGRRQFLVTPSILASNQSLAQRTPSGADLYPVESLGDWRCSLVTTPTVYRPAITGLRAIETLIGYLKSSMSGLVAESQRGLLRDYLKRFPGGTEVGWIDGINSVSLHPVASLQNGHTQSGLAIAIAFDSERYRTTSKAMVRRVIGELFEGQRGINRVEEVIVRFI